MENQTLMQTSHGMKEACSKLGKNQKTVIESSSDLDSFLKKEANGGQLVLMFEPSDHQLEKLLERDDLQIIVPPPRHRPYSGLEHND